MKLIKSLTFAIAIIFAFSTLSVAQTKDAKKAGKKEIKKKPIKEAKKEAKAFKKQGYTVSPGALPMGKQIETAWIRQYEIMEDGYPLYIVASGNSVENTQSAEK